MVRLPDTSDYLKPDDVKDGTEAHAILRGGTEITQDDIDAIASLSKWINYDFKEI